MIQDQEHWTYCHTLRFGIKNLVSIKGTIDKQIKQFLTHVTVPCAMSVFENAFPAITKTILRSFPFADHRMCFPSYTIILTHDRHSVGRMVFVFHQLGIATIIYLQINKFISQLAPEVSCQNYENSRVSAWEMMIQYKF